MKMTRAFLGFDGRSRLIASADDDGKGDDGKGGGDGDGKDKDIDPKIADYINRSISGALTAHGKRQATSFGETMKSQLAEFAKTFKPEPVKPDDKTDDGKGSGDGKAKPDPEVLKLKQSLADMQAKLTAKEEEGKAITLKQQRGEERQALNVALEKLGIPASRQPAVIALLHSDRQVVGRNEAGEVAMKVQRTYQGQKQEEFVTIDEGLSDWAKTDEGKSFLPPVRGTGGGERGGERPRTKDGKPTAGDAYGYLMENLGK